MYSNIILISIITNYFAIYSPFFKAQKKLFSCLISRIRITDDSFEFAEISFGNYSATRLKRGIVTYSKNLFDFCEIDNFFLQRSGFSPLI